MQSDLSNKLRLLVEKDYIALSRYALSSWLADHSVLFRDYIFVHTAPSSIFEGRTADSSEQNLAKTVSIYMLNVRFIRAICREMGITPLFVLQPLITTKKGLTEFERGCFDSIESNHVEFARSFYKAVIEEMNSAADFVDLSSLLDNDGVSDFYDYGHTGPSTGETLGQAIGKQALVRIKAKKP